MMLSYSFGWSEKQKSDFRNFGILPDLSDRVFQPFDPKTSKRGRCNEPERNSRGDNHSTTSRPRLAE